MSGINRIYLNKLRGAYKYALQVFVVCIAFQRSNHFSVFIRDGEKICKSVDHFSEEIIESSVEEYLNLNKKDFPKKPHPYYFVRICIDKYKRSIEPKFLWGKDI
jgi:hypothetical protein